VPVTAPPVPVSKVRVVENAYKIKGKKGKENNFGTASEYSSLLRY
jgi:hypothetical protein